MGELLALANEAQLEVRVVGRPSRLSHPSWQEPDRPAESGVCRVRGAVWVVLSAADPIEVQLDLLAGALRDHAGALIDARYLPPAVRARLHAGPGPV